MVLTIVYNRPARVSKATVGVGAGLAGPGVILSFAIAGVVISFYYYFGVIRAIYWSRDAADLTPIHLSSPIKLVIAICIAGMFWLGIFPNALVNFATVAAQTLH